MLPLASVGGKTPSLAGVRALVGDPTLTSNNATHFDWLLQKEETSHFAAWLCRVVSTRNVLTEDEVDEFDVATLEDDTSDADDVEDSETIADDIQMLREEIAAKNAIVKQFDVICNNLRNESKALDKRDKEEDVLLELAMSALQREEEACKKASEVCDERDKEVIDGLNRAADRVEELKLDTSLLSLDETTQGMKDCANQVAEILSSYSKPHPLPSQQDDILTADDPNRILFDLEKDDVLRTLEDIQYYSQLLVDAKHRELCCYLDTQSLKSATNYVENLSETLNSEPSSDGIYEEESELKSRVMECKKELELLLEDVVKSLSGSINCKKALIEEAEVKQKRMEYRMKVLEVLTESVEDWCRTGMIHWFLIKEQKSRVEVLEEIWKGVWKSSRGANVQESVKESAASDTSTDLLTTFKKILELPDEASMSDIVNTSVQLSSDVTASEKKIFRDFADVSWKKLDMWRKSNAALRRSLLFSGTLSPVLMDPSISTRHFTLCQDLTRQLALLRSRDISAVKDKDQERKRRVAVYFLTAPDKLQDLLKRRHQCE